MEAGGRAGADGFSDILGQVCAYEGHVEGEVWRYGLERAKAIVAWVVHPLLHPQQHLLTSVSICTFVLVKQVN